MPAPVDSGSQMFSGFFAGLASSFAIGFAIVAKQMYDGMESSGGSAADLELGKVSGRAGVPTMKASAGDAQTRREVLSKVLSASAFTAAAANAEIDYAGVGFLGGSKTIDVNNANIRVYQKLPGMYPNAAGKIVAKAPYKSKDEMYSKAGFTEKEKETVKKYDSNFVFLEPRPEYIIDNINNGLYR